MPRLLRPALLAAPFALLGALVPAFAEPLTISIANFGDHPQLNAVAEGFKAEILASGLVDGTDVVFTLDHVNFDTTLLPQMIAKIESGKPALVLAITTPVSQNVLSCVYETGAALFQHGVQRAPIRQARHG